MFSLVVSMSIFHSCEKEKIDLHASDRNQIEIEKDSMDFLVKSYKSNELIAFKQFQNQIKGSELEKAQPVTYGPQDCWMNTGNYPNNTLQKGSYCGIGSTGCSGFTKCAMAD